MPTAEELVAMLVKGGCIVSTGDCSPLEIAQARACRRLHVDARGLGFVYRPAARVVDDGQGQPENAMDKQPRREQRKG